MSGMAVEDLNKTDTCNFTDPRTGEFGPSASRPIMASHRLSREQQQDGLALNGIQEDEYQSCNMISVQGQSQSLYTGAANLKETVTMARFICSYQRKRTYSKQYNTTVALEETEKYVIYLTKIKK